VQGMGSGYCQVLSIRSPRPLALSPFLHRYTRPYTQIQAHPRFSHTTSYLAPYVSVCLPLLALLPSACVGNSTRIEVNMHHTLCDSLLCASQKLPSLWRMRRPNQVQDRLVLV